MPRRARCRRRRRRDLQRPPAARWCSSRAATAAVRSATAPATAGLARGERRADRDHGAAARQRRDRRRGFGRLSTDRPARRGAARRFLRCRGVRGGHERPPSDPGPAARWRAGAHPVGAHALTRPEEGHQAAGRRRLAGRTRSKVYACAWKGRWPHAHDGDDPDQEAHGTAGRRDQRADVHRRPAARRAARGHPHRSRWRSWQLVSGIWESTCAATAPPTWSTSRPGARWATWAAPTASTSRASPTPTDFAIVGLGTCGSCTSFTIADAVAVERTRSR